MLPAIHRAEVPLRRLAVLAVLLTVALTGCQTTSSDADPFATDRQHRTDLLAENSPRPRRSAGSDRVETDDLGRRAARPPALPSRVARPSGTLPPDRPSLAKQLDKPGTDPDEVLVVQLNFDGDNAATVVQAFSMLLGFQYYIDPSIQGTVTLRVDSEMTRSQVWNLMEHILWLGGAYASPDDGFAHVMPFAKMPQERRLFASHPPQANVDVRLVNVRLVPAKTVVTAIQPFMTEGASATVMQELNSILLVEAPANVPKLLELIAQLDQLGEARWPQISVPLEHVEAATIVEELATILPILGFPVSTSGRGDGVSVKLAALPRIQSVIASAPTQDLLDEIVRWVSVLDRGDSKDVERIFFYEAKYNDAKRLADAVTTFFTNSSASGNAAAVTAESQTTETAPSDTATTTDPAAALSDQSGTVFTTAVRIYVDENHNRLVIRTAPRAYATIDALLHRLDTPPLQVLIQVSIAEITLTKSTEFGFAYAWQKALGGNTEVDTGLDVLGDGSVADLIVRSMSDPTKVFAKITAIAGKGNTRVLFAPQIMVLNGEKAMINVGDEVPIVTSENNTNDSDNITRSIQFRSTGTILTVTPRITAEHMVRLELNQEVSDAVKTTSSTIDSPTIQTRSLESTLLIEDGTTLLLGGLISTRNVNNDSGLPGVKDIPVIGVPFKNQSKERERRELLLLLTVHVIDMDSDVQRLVRRYQTALEALGASPAAPDAPVRDSSRNHRPE